MLDLNWITTSGTAALMVVVKAVAIYATLLILVHMAGLRSFAKMSSFIPTIVDNKPLLLTAGSKVIDANLTKCQVTESDLNSKLRQAGVTLRDQVLTVIMETTGDVSVLKVSEVGDRLDPSVFDDFFDAQLLRGLPGSAL